MYGSCHLCFQHSSSTHKSERSSSKQLAAQSKEGLGWLVIGDFGHRGNPEIKMVAQKMDSVASQEDIYFLINTGDSFY